MSGTGAADAGALPIGIRKGDRVTVHYTGTLADGAVFDSSAGKEPLSFVAGAGEMIEGFDKAVLGRMKGESFTITVPPKEAYGEFDRNLVLVTDRNQFPEDFHLQEGMHLVVGLEGAGNADVTVVKIGDGHVVLDANHPLAGEALTFAVTVVDVEACHE